MTATSDPTVVDLVLPFLVLRNITVRRELDGTYRVLVNGEDKHGPCTAEDVMRALAMYLIVASASTPC